jgi:SMI1 / KNR4 family (SUKH-1)
MSSIPADKEGILAEFNGNPPADAASLQRFQTEAGFRLPEEYAKFLRERDGGEGFIGDTYLILWRVSELVGFNKDYQVAEYAPGLFLFGTDGGGEAFAFDIRSEAKPIVSVPFVGMDLKSIRAVAPNFESFVDKLTRP